MRFLEEHARAHPGRWFFLYHAMSGVGRYGDLVMEADRVVGELIRTVDRLGMGANALIVFASDNGPEICVREVRPEFGHNAAGTPRGLKRANWGGHRVPFMGRGRGKIPRGREIVTTRRWRGWWGCCSVIRRRAGATEGLELPQYAARQLCAPNGSGDPIVRFM